MNKMDFPHVEEMINESSWCFNQYTIADENNGWRKLCATDCNGNIQNIGNPSKTSGCYLFNSGSRHPDGKKNKGEFKKSKESSSVQQSSVFENVLLKINSNQLNAVFDKTVNSVVSKEIMTRKDNNRLIDSELSYFSDKNSLDLGLSKFVENNSEYSNPKNFTLFPEKSNSSPSILDGLDSYFKKDTPPRSRCLSDPQNKTLLLSAEKYNDSSPDSGFNGKELSSDFVTSRISSLKSKIDELELEFKIKDETINENTKLPSFLADKHCHGANEQTSLQQEKTILGESFTSLYGLIPKRLFESQSLQENKSVATSENKHVIKKKANYSYPRKVNNPETYDVEKSKPKIVVPFRNTDIYPFQPNAYHSLNYPPINRQALYYNVDPVGLSREWLSFINKFQTFSTRSEDNLYRSGNVLSQDQAHGKKNYRKNNHNQQPGMECKFCKSNMESPKMYKSHNLKQRIGRRTFVTCPVLRKLVCERCGETGDNAHTLSYCPLVIAESGKKPVSVAAELKKTKRVASGRMRKPF